MYQRIGTLCSAMMCRSSSLIKGVRTARLVHDYPSYIPPHKYDIMLTDIDEKCLDQLGKRKGIENLSRGSFSQAFPVNGVLYGPFHRFMIPSVCQHAMKPHMPIINVWFLVDTASADTFLSGRTILSLCGPRTTPTKAIDLAIQDQRAVTQCHISRGHFAEANVLGSNAMRDLKITIEKINWDDKSFRLAKQ